MDAIGYAIATQELATRPLGGRPMWVAMPALVQSSSGWFRAASGWVPGPYYIESGGDTGAVTNPIQTANVLDPVGATWTAKASDTTTLLQASAMGASDANGVYYVFGGNSNSGVTGQARQYQPSSNTWTAKASSSNPRYGGGAVLTGTVFSLALGNNNGAIATTEVYDPVGNAFTAKLANPTARYQVASGQDGTGKALYVGGTADGATPLPNNDLFDPTANSWTAKASYPLGSTAGVYEAGAAYLSSVGLLVVVGGLVRVSGSPIQYGASAYSPSGNAWQNPSASYAYPLGPNPQGFSNASTFPYIPVTFPAVAAIDSKTIISGGGGGAGTQNAAVIVPSGFASLLAYLATRDD